MTNRIENVLLNYLQTETNHAILLTGDWGSGKTYYLKEIFFEKAKEIKTIGSGATIKYKPLLISLYGAKSVDDVKDRIWLKLYPILDNKKTQNGLSIINGIIKSIDVTKLIGKEGILEGLIDNFGKVATNINKKAKENQKFDNYLLCLDDLERTNEALKDEEILGFVNSLVEHDNNKVILIANEDKINSERFKEIKEKTIGFTLHFEQNFKEVFENFVENYNTTNSFKNYLKEQYEPFYELFTKDGQSNVNYRTLKNTVTVFGQIYHLIEEKGLGSNALMALKEIILQDILRFTAGISIEFRKGNLSYKDNKGLSNYNTVIYSKILGNESDKDSFILKFIRRYIKNENRYHYYKSIYETVTGGNTFDLERLLEELRKNNNVIDGNIPIQYTVYNKILEHDYLRIPDREYKQLLRDLKNYAIHGVFKITDYPTVLYALFRDGNLLNLSERNVTRQFISVVNKKKNGHIYHPLLAKNYTTDPNFPLNEFQQKLIDSILKINEEARKHEADDKLSDLKQLCSSDFPAFFQQFLTFHYRNTGNFSLEGFSGSFLYSTFLKLSNSEKHDFNNLLYLGYLDSIYALNNYELDLFEDFKSKVDKKLKGKNPKANSTNLLKKLQEVLNNILEKKGKRTINY